MTGTAGSTPTVYLTASTPVAFWKRLVVEISSEDFALACRTAPQKAVMGSARTVLGDGESDEIDIVNSVEVQLVDPNQWMTSCDDAALAAGANLALVGDELIQFGDVEAIGAGRFRLTRLLRGRYATAWATSTHAGGDLFLLIERPALQRIDLPASAQGSVVTATCRVAGSPASATCLVDGRSLRSALFINGEQVLGSRVAAIASPSGGANVDAEVRTAVSQILGALRTHGLIDT